MRYIRVEWLHEDPDEPVWLYSELDEESWEVRKVEVHRDGSMGFADRLESARDTGLGLIPLPDIDEIAASPEFRPEEISRDEFQRIWDEAHLAARHR